MERLLADISFNAGGDYPDTVVKVDRHYVEEKLNLEQKARNLKKYII